MARVVLDESKLAPWRAHKLVLPDFGPAKHGDATGILKPRPKKRKKSKYGSGVHRRVFARDGYACRYCGRACVNWPPRGPDGRFIEVCHLPRPAHARTLDHVVPRSKGGAHTDDNCVVACFQCNNEKDDAVWVPRPLGDG